MKPTGLLLLIGLVLVVGTVVWMLRLAASANSDRLLPGDSAPDFTAMATGGQHLSLHELRGQPVILVFYPMDNTPGCTIQLCALRDQWGRLKEHEVAVLGINPGNLDSHEKFARQHHYPFPLVVDENGEIARRYGVKRTMGVNQRTVFVLDGEGVVRYSKEGLPSVGELMAVVQQLPQKAPRTPTAETLIESPPAETLP